MADTPPTPDVAPGPARGTKRCGRLIGSEWVTTPDVCEMEEGHTNMLEPTPHKGRWTGIRWLVDIDKEGKRTRRILDEEADLT